MATALPLLNASRNEVKTRTARSGGRLVVAVNAKPRDYTPNSGPCVSRPALVPPQDSTAHICERLLMKPDRIAKDGKALPFSAVYLVEFHDLPAAKLLIPVVDVLDYVSPRELERFETQYEDDRDELLLMKDEVEQKEQGGTRRRKRKRGRPPKNTQIESALAVDMEAEQEGNVHLKGGALSLSTPKKMRLKDFEGLSDDDMSPSRQIEREIFKNEAYSAQEEIDAVDAVHHDEQLASGVEENMPADTSSIAGSDPLLEGAGLELPTPAMISDDDPAPLVEANSTLDEKLQKSPVAPLKPIGNPETKSNMPLKSAFLAISSGQTTSRSLSAPESAKAPGPSNKPKKPISIKTSRAKQEKKPRSTKKPQQAPISPESDGEAEWVVERIEDDNVYQVEGRGLIHHFKVRWEGDWPADQNPSWEPEENIPKNMIQNYFKNGKKRRQKEKKPSSKWKQTTLSWTKAKRYSNVSEAFEGDDIIDQEEEDELALTNTNGVDPGSSIAEPEENAEVFIVDETFDGPSTPRVEWRGNGNRLLFRSESSENGFFG